MYKTMACSLVSMVLMCVLTMRGVISNDTKDTKDDLWSIVGPVMKCSNISALSITLTKSVGKNEVKSYEMDANNAGSETSNKIFCIGGATRAFTAVLLAKLMSEHPNITWDTPIRDIVTDRIDLPYQFLANNLNLKDIFAMRSGLAGMDIVPVAKPYSVNELIRKLRYAPPVAGFRDKFIYNEVLFSLVEKVVYVLGNDTWQNLIKRHIFTPLKMTSTTFLGPDTYNKPSFVKGSVRYGDGSVNLEADAYSGTELISPAASVCTTADDMLSWFSFLLKNEKVWNRNIVEKAALEETYSAVQVRGIDADPLVTGISNYSRHSNALGWINGFYRGFPFVSQDGSIPGYQSLATIVHSEKLAVFVAFSGDHDVKRYAAKVLLNKMLLDYLTGRERQNATDVCAIIRNVKEINKNQRKSGVHISRNDAKAPRPLEDYVGTYRNYAYGDILVNTSVDSVAGESGLTLQYGLAEYKLYSTNQNNTFQLIIRTGSLWYSNNADWYRFNHEIFAEFISDSHEEDQKFTSVRIDGFDRHYIPEFSKNAREPHYKKYTDDCRCSAPVLTAWQWAILLVITAMHFS